MELCSRSVAADTHTPQHTPQSEHSEHDGTRPKQHTHVHTGPDGDTHGSFNLGNNFSLTPRPEHTTERDQPAVECYSPTDRGFPGS